jgi:transglutaminase-like putative cysteine protease
MRHLAWILLLSFAPALAAVDPPSVLDPEEAVALLAGAEASRYEGSDRVVVFDRTEVDVEETGLSHRYDHRLVKVLDWSGARALAALRFDFDPASNIVEILAVRVHRADSTFVDVDPASVVDATAPAHLIYWGGRMRVLGVGALEPGDGVETITYKKGFQIAYLDAESEDERYIPPMRGHFYDVLLFQEDLPLIEKSYTVHVPKDKPLQYSVYNGEVMSSLTFGEDTHIYRFWRENVPALKREPRMPDASDVVPKVVMATVPDWEEKSRWFYHVNEDRDIFGWNPEIEEKVNEITRGLKTEDQKIAALLHWVAQNIRYSGLNMGEGEGYTLHPSTMTFRDRCGVCKDIAGMLVTMLRVAGYPTFAAMTMAGSRVERIPADQFNHCVVALRKEDGSYLMLDPTWAPWNNPIWSRWEGEQHYVIGSSEGEDLMMIPAFVPEDNLLVIRSDAKILKDGALEGTLVLDGKGAMDGRIRSAAADRAKRDVRSGIEEWLGAVSPDIELIEYRFTDPRDFTIDSSLRIRYRVPRFADLLGNDLVFRSPALRFIAENARLSRLAFMPDNEERAHGVFLWGPQRIAIDETVKLPSGYKAEEPKKVSVEEKIAAAKLSWEANGGTLVLKGETMLEKRQLTAKEYAGARKARNAVVDASNNDLYAKR